MQRDMWQRRKTGAEIEIFDPKTKPLTFIRKKIYVVFQFWNQNEPQLLQRDHSDVSSEIKSFSVTAEDVSLPSFDTGVSVELILCINTYKQFLKFGASSETMCKLTELQQLGQTPYFW